jgi:CheY-like chemotaxis protein
MAGAISRPGLAEVESAMETSQPQSILLATSDPENGRALHELVSPCGRTIVQASSVPEAEEALSDGLWLAFCEDRLPGGGYGEFLRRSKLAGPQVPVVVSSSWGGPEQYLEARHKLALRTVQSCCHVSPSNVNCRTAKSVVAFCPNA